MKTQVKVIIIVDVARCLRAVAAILLMLM